MASNIQKISGFPEWLPEQKIVENIFLARLRKLFESFGFAPLETAAVEHVETLQSKGVADKEIYGLRRLAAEESDTATVALHFDLTVPTARFVAQHLGELVFPFKRYQMQKVWRGDRPQRGRFREFYQVDIDIIGRGDLPLVADAEALTVLDRMYRLLQLPKHELRCNTRKVLLGFYESLGLAAEQRSETIRIVDKILKIGVDGVSKDLRERVGLSAETIERIIRFSSLRFAARELEARVSSLGVSNATFSEGVTELLATFALLPPETVDAVVVDFSLARGLDYYTGIICEVMFSDYQGYGSVGGGGRYDNLASQFTSEKLPGVGFSFGFTRIMSLLWEEKILTPKRRSPADVVVTVASENRRLEAQTLAEMLRGYGLAVDVPFSAAKFGKQIEYADKRGIRYVLFVGEGDKPHEVKDLLKQVQVPISDLKLWAAAVASEGEYSN